MHPHILFNRVIISGANRTYIGEIEGLLEFNLKVVGGLSDGGLM